MDNSLSVLVERLVLGEHRVVGSAGSFWAASGRLEHNPCFNPSDMTGEGQSHCLDPKGSCPGKGDTDPTAKHPALPCSGNTTTRAGLGPAPVKAWSCGSCPCQQDFHATPCTPNQVGGTRGEWGLAFRFTDSGGQRAPKRGARQGREVWGRERGGLACLQALNSGADTT